MNFARHASTFNKVALSPMCREDTLSSVHRRRRGTLSPCVSKTLYSLYREYAPSLHIAEGAPLQIVRWHSLLRVEKTLSPLYNEEASNPLCREEEHTLRCGEKGMSSSLSGRETERDRERERDALSFATWRSLPPPFIEERHFPLYS